MADMKDPFINKAIIQLWDMNSNLRHNFSVTASLQSSTEDRPGERWWNSAIMQALMTMSSLTGVPGVHNGTFSETGGDPGAALFALTGHSAVAKERSYYGWPDKIDADRMFAEMRTAYYNRSPMVITTYQGDVDESGLMQDSVLYSYHAYGFMWPRRYKNGTMTAMLRNPWGKSTEVQVSELIHNMSWMYHLHDFAALNWTAGNNGEYPYWGHNKKQMIWEYDDPIQPLDDEMPAVQDITMTLSDRVTTYAQASAKYTMTYTPTEASTTAAVATPTGPTAIAQPTAPGQSGQSGQSGEVQPTGQAGQAGQSGQGFGGGDLTEITDEAGWGGAGGAGSGSQNLQQNQGNGSPIGQISPIGGPPSGQLASSQISPMTRQSPSPLAQQGPVSGQAHGPAMPTPTGNINSGGSVDTPLQTGLVALELPNPNEVPATIVPELGGVVGTIQSSQQGTVIDPSSGSGEGFIKGGGLIALERTPEKQEQGKRSVGGEGKSAIEPSVQDDAGQPRQYRSADEPLGAAIPAPLDSAPLGTGLTDGTKSSGGGGSETVSQSTVEGETHPVVNGHADGQNKGSNAKRTWAKRRSRP